MSKRRFLGERMVLPEVAHKRIKEADRAPVVFEPAAHVQVGHGAERLVHQWVPTATQHAWNNPHVSWLPLMRHTCNTVRSMLAHRQQFYRWTAGERMSGVPSRRTRV